MDVRNCRRCGKIYLYDGSPICPQCRKEEEEDFKKVKEYLYDHPGATLPEVSNATGVSPEKILRFLKEERLEIVGESNIILECERCGKAIKTGRLCDECKKEVGTRFLSYLDDKKLQESKKKNEEFAKRKEAGYRYLSKDLKEDDSK
ncbi:Flagellar operon protein YvyF [Caldicellulosiruptor acetigenus I77R1B]|uniref:Flagellar operon protein TIGR03826 n=2 Tax=Caldicellulosiruptor acetigenus TaxID=301953 RepID=G2PW06_9FIRM|nr:TIGR03826 family flagellar region protein [Caldicellulosiruptor acetigenus]ADQ41183.1 Flagellar operon protein YvyF [Caldicellulosiruptor acetigenus I77R1B]AEM73724.1 flagellar operon protein TIGR03826 [Caldicellulosiruptor acetigenus 6A]